MRIRTSIVSLIAALAWGLPAAQAQIAVNLAPGSFTYQFADPVSGQPITSLNFDNVGDTKGVAVYLLQIGGSPTNLLQQLGAEALAVRLVYNNPVGIVRVPSVAYAKPNPDFDFVKIDASTNPRSSGLHTLDTSTNVSIAEGILANPVQFPGAEDPLGNPRRMLIGTFTLSALSSGSESLVAMDATNYGTLNMTGPNPTTAPDDAFHGEVYLDQYLTGYTSVPAVVGSLTVSVSAVPEPSTIALVSLAAGGLAWQRRRHRPKAAG
jgi:hypothetical protein